MRRPRLAIDCPDARMTRPCRRRPRPARIVPAHRPARRRHGCRLSGPLDGPAHGRAQGPARADQRDRRPTL